MNAITVQRTQLREILTGLFYLWSRDGEFDPSDVVADKGPRMTTERYLTHHFDPACGGVVEYSNQERHSMAFDCAERILLQLEPDRQPLPARGRAGGLVEKERCDCPPVHAIIRVHEPYCRFYPADETVQSGSGVEHRLRRADGTAPSSSDPDCPHRQVRIEVDLLDGDTIPEAPDGRLRCVSCRKDLGPALVEISRPGKAIATDDEPAAG